MTQIRIPRSQGTDPSRDAELDLHILAYLAPWAGLCDELASAGCGQGRRGARESRWGQGDRGPLGDSGQGRDRGGQGSHRSCR